MMRKKRILVGISGASGIPVAVEILKLLKLHTAYERHLVISDSGKTTIFYENEKSIEEIEALADCVYNNHSIGSAIASGSYRNEGMIIVPCSMKTVAGIANGYSDSLLLRAADVAIKERRRLVLVPRECPLSSIHLENMLKLSNLGVDILPMVMTFYNNPKSINDMVHHMACKCLERFSITVSGYKRWMDN